MAKHPPPAACADQDGLLSRAQALEAGLTASAIRHAIRPDGPWQRILPGVYGTFTGPLTQTHRIRAALLAAGPGAVVTGPRACRLWGLTYGPLPGDTVDVLIDSRQDRGSVGFVHVVRTNRLPRPVAWIDDDSVAFDDRPLDVVAAGGSGVLPLAPVARAVVDTVIDLKHLPADWRPTCPEMNGCRDCPGNGHRTRALQNVRALMCEAVQRRRVSTADLEGEVKAAARRGSALARAAMRDIVAGCRSAPECELRDVIRGSRVLPEPRWNRPLPGHPEIVPDACWPEARLVVEVDSRSFHGFGDAPERTERRRVRYAELGWRVLPVSPGRLRADPKAVRWEIESAFVVGRRDG